MTTLDMIGGGNSCEMGSALGKLLGLRAGGRCINFVSMNIDFALNSLPATSSSLLKYCNT